MARMFGWTMQEVRAHSVRDLRAMAAAVEREQRERERAERRKAAHKASAAMR